MPGSRSCGKRKCLLLIPGRLVILWVIEVPVPGQEEGAKELLQLQGDVQADRHDVVEDDQEREELLKDEAGTDLDKVANVPEECSTGRLSAAITSEWPGCLV